MKDEKLVKAVACIWVVAAVQLKWGKELEKLLMCLQRMW